jgi:hypothetical protein
MTKKNLYDSLFDFTANPDYFEYTKKPSRPIQTSSEKPKYTLAELLAETKPAIVQNPNKPHGNLYHHIFDTEKTKKGDLSWSDINLGYEENFRLSPKKYYTDSFELGTPSLLPKKPVDYTFNEDKYIQDALEHITATYSQHYAGSKYQATDIIIDSGHGTGFNVGNAMKYLKRYGKKEGYNRKDLLKAIHYIIIQLHVHDIENLDKDTSE